MFKLQFTGIPDFGIKPEEITVSVSENNDPKTCEEFLDNIVCEEDHTIDFLKTWKSMCEYQKSKKGYEDVDEWDNYDNNM